MPVPKKGVDEVVADMIAGREIRFADLAKVCEHYFGKPRQNGTSHHVYKMPWPGNPRVNIQNDNGTSKRYQVKQVLAAIVKLKEMAEANKK